MSHTPTPDRGGVLSTGRGSHTGPGGPDDLTYVIFHSSSDHCSPHVPSALAFRAQGLSGVCLALQWWFVHSGIFPLDSKLFEGRDLFGTTRFVCSAILSVNQCLLNGRHSAFGTDASCFGQHQAGHLPYAGHWPHTLPT